MAFWLSWFGPMALKLWCFGPMACWRSCSGPMAFKINWFCSMALKISWFGPWPFDWVDSAPWPRKMLIGSTALQIVDWPHGLENCWLAPWPWKLLIGSMALKIVGSAHGLENYASAYGLVKCWLAQRHLRNWRCGPRPRRMSIGTKALKNVGLAPRPWKLLIMYLELSNSLRFYNQMNKSYCSRCLAVPDARHSSYKWYAGSSNFFSPFLI